MTALSAPDRRAFWLQRKGWPAIDYPGALFLGRAINQLGQARHGVAWTGSEPVAFVPPPIGPLGGAFAGRPNPPRSIAAIHHAPLPPPPRPDPDQHRLRVEAREREIEAATRAVARWADVHRTLWGWLIEGRIGFAVRWSDGQMRPGGAMAWNAEKASDYLTDCRLPYSGGWSTTFLPVFVSSDDFAACLKPSALAASATVAAETAAIAALTTLFRDNRTKRTMTNPILKGWVEAEIGRALTKAQFERAKASAARDAAAPVWTAGGAPTGPRA